MNTSSSRETGSALIYCSIREVSDDMIKGSPRSVPISIVDGVCKRTLPDDGQGRPPIQRAESRPGMGLVRAAAKNSESGLSSGDEQRMKSILQQGGLEPMEVQSTGRKGCRLN